MTLIDIRYNSDQKHAKRLSNLSSHPFIIDGEKCTSMESFLQSLKYEDQNEQRKIRALHGTAAQKKGQERNEIWQEKQMLWFRDKAYDRHSQDYQHLISRAFRACYEQDEYFKKALRDTKGTIVHSIGKQDPTKTVLTEKELCDNLEPLRKLAQDNP